MHPLRLRLPAYALVILAMVWPAGFVRAQATVFNLGTDWSDVNNPNGAWRINKAPGQTFTINQNDYWSNGSGQHAWAEQPFAQTAHVPVWMKVQSGDTNFTGFASPGTIVMHTAETARTGTEFSSVTWTSSGDGSLAISGGVWVQKVYDRPQRWELRLNGTSLSTGDLSLGDAFTQANPFSFAAGSGGASVLNQTVHQGDVFELLLYRQSSATPGTFVGMDLAVSFTAVPEPVTSGLFAFGLAAIMIARRRRVS